MTLEDEFNQTVWWTLQEIKKEKLATPDNHKGFLPFDYSSANEAPAMPDQRRAVRLLIRSGAISIVDRQYPLKMSGMGADAFGWKPISLTLEVHPKFDEVYEQYNPEKKTYANDEPWAKPIVKKLEDGQRIYKKDGLVYSLWKYANASRVTGKSLIAFTDIMPLTGSETFVIYEFLTALQGLKIELEGITFHEDIYKKYCKEDHQKISEYIAEHPQSELSIGIQKLWKNKATFNDIFTVFGKVENFFHLNKGLTGMMEFVEFSPRPSQNNIAPLTSMLDDYIQCFTEDRLFSTERKNFYKFSRQKDIFLANIRNEVRDYGKEFTFRQGEVVSVEKGLVVSIHEDEAYLFIHTLVALEKQGLFEVESILIVDMDIPPEEQTNDYKVRVVASQKLLDEYKPLKEISTEKHSPLPTNTTDPDELLLAVKDREIWINEFLIAKPFATGTGYEFLEYIRSQEPNTPIVRTKLPELLKADTKGKSFIKLLNGLGFKGELLKTFFYDRGEHKITYRGDRITDKMFREAGVRPEVVLKELELAHLLKSSPK